MLLKVAPQITDKFSLECTWRSRLVQSPAQSRPDYIRLLKVMARQVLNTSSDGDSTAYQGNRNCKQ